MLNKNVRKIMENKKSFLAYEAYNMRILSIEATTAAGSGHPTSCLSSADIMSVIFFHAMHFDSQNPNNSNNDRFILSKGHAAPLLYAVWKELGVLTYEDLLKLREIDSVLEGHPTPRFSRADVATGSLGMGLSMGAGMALNANMRSLPYYTYVLLGDSELSEGSIWEAAEIAAYYHLKNLIAVVDVNNLGQRGETIDGYRLDAIAQKFKAFGWQTYEVDGHNIDDLIIVFDQTRKKDHDKPQIILAKTIKGYGIASVEGKNGFHGKAFSKQELPALKEELKKRFYQKSWDKEFASVAPQQKVKSVENNQEIVASQEIMIEDPEYNVGDQIATRVAFGQALVQVGKKSDAVICLDAEVSNSTYTIYFAGELKKRFIECFVAEQNMVGMAIGLAARKNIPFVATFGAFLTRAFDQLRMAAISRSALRVVGSHAGVSIGQDGPSQMALEDIAMMRTLPDSIILYPSDAVSCYKLVALMSNYDKGISYLRTTRGKTPVIYNNSESFTIGDFKVLYASDHDCAVIIAAGITLHESLKAYEILKQEGIAVVIVDLYTIKPLNVERLKDVVKKSGNRVITVEDHYVNGGIGESVTYALRNELVDITCLAVYELPRSGSEQELLKWAHIDAGAIINAVKNK